MVIPITDTIAIQNPFQNPDAKPEWAQLTRLGGDRTSILFEELRAKISCISGLSEELYFYSDGEGWMPRYRVGDRVFLKVQILPGNLTAMVRFEEQLSSRLLNSVKVAGRIKMWLQNVSIREGIALLRVRLSSRADICSLANFLTVINKG